AEMLRCMADGTVKVSDTARELAPSVLYPAAFPPRAVWDIAHLISMSVLPDAIRRGYGLPWSPERARGMERMATLSRRLVPLVPRRLRRVPQAVAAEHRVGNRDR
ncbi:MAG: oxygenase MpaB family protein, partial [Actinomycetes bacterium]